MSVEADSWALNPARPLDPGIDVRLPTAAQTNYVHRVNGWYQTKAQRSHSE